MSSKRKREDYESSDNQTQNGNKKEEQKDQRSNKGQVQEGHSWWTCLMYGMPQEKSSPQFIPKVTFMIMKEQYEADTLEAGSDEEKHILPPPPEKPLDSDCCGTGCVPCVFDIYEQECKIWERNCKKLQQQDSQIVENLDGQMLCNSEYRTFTVESVIRETRDTYRYIFMLPGERSLGLKIGQHVVLRGIGDGRAITRQYTPVSDVHLTGQFEMLIKIYDDGKMSEYIKTWVPGTSVELRGPFGDFTYKANQYKRLIMLAAGTGIAPMAQIIQGVLNNDMDDTQIQLLYSCRQYDDVLMKSELSEWSKYWNFSVLYILSQEPADAPPGSYRYGDRIHKGRTDLELLTSEMTVLDDSKVLVCGTKSFDKDMLKYCLKLNIPEASIHKF